MTPNILVLDQRPRTCAEMHCDADLMAMPKVYVELLNAGSVLHHAGTAQTPLVKHVLGRWSSNYVNWWWLYDVFTRALWEQQYRFGCFDEEALDFREEIKFIGEAPKHIEAPRRFVQIMDSQFKVPGDAVTAYRNWYQQDQQGAAWTKRKAPSWWRAETQSTLF